jgi:hypothetical protein
LHGRLIGFQLIEESVFELSQLGLQGIDVLADQAGDEQVFLTPRASTTALSAFAGVSSKCTELVIST